MVASQFIRVTSNLILPMTAVVLTSILASTALAQQSRTWVDATGEFKIDATYESLTDDSVLLKLSDGSFKQIPLSMLSDSDQDYVRKLNVPDQPPTQESPMDDSQTPPPSQSPVASPPTDATAAPRSPTPETKSVDVSPPKVLPPPPESEPPTAMPEANAADLTLKRSDLKRPDPIIYIGERIGDLEIDDIVPPPIVNGFRSNPKYLLPVERSDLILLPEEFQGVALLLLEEARKPRDAIRGLEYLKVHWPKNRQPTLIKLVINCASSDYKFNRESALEILANRDSDQSFAYIFARVDDTSFTIRSTAYQLLRRIGDRRAIGPVAKRFDSDDVDRIASLLRSFGSDSESAMLPFLTHEDPDIRLRACNLIGKIGTEKSLPALQEMAAREETRILQAQTRSAINKIKRRSNTGQ